MAILNYTTSIDAERTAGEIQKILAAAGAQAILSEYDDNAAMVAMSFRIMTQHGLITFRLPSRIDGVYRELCNSKKVPNRLKTKEQATKVAWRILKNWVEAQIAITQTEMAEIPQVFLPYAQDANGSTVYDKLKGENFKALTLQC